MFYFDQRARNSFERMKNDEAGSVGQEVIGRRTLYRKDNLPEASPTISAV